MRVDGTRALFCCNFNNYRLVAISGGSSKLLTQLRVFSFLRTIVSVFLCFSFVSTLHAAGMLVDPSSIKIREIMPGMKTAVISAGDYAVRIENRDDAQSEYRVTLLTCKECDRAPSPGYWDVLDSRWFVARSVTVSVPGKSAGYARGLSIKIPRPGENASRRYQGILKVERIKPASPVNMEVLLPVSFELANKNTRGPAAAGR